MYSPIVTETFKRSYKYPWYEEFSEERMSYVDEDKNIIVHEYCVNMCEENNSQYIPFEIDRYYQGIDLMDMMFQIYFVNSQMGGNHDTPINVEYSDHRIHFGWLVDKNATFISGNLMFEIRAIGEIDDGNGNKIEYVWKTRPNYQINIEKSLTGNDYFEPTEDWYIELVKVINRKIDVAQAAMEAAQLSEKNALASESSAKTSERNALASANAAKVSQESAAASATSIEIAASQSESWAVASQSWAVGGTNTRADENTNNAKYWSNKTEDAIKAALNSGQNIVDETNNRINEDNKLRQSITDETNNRVNEDNKLSNSINTTNTNLNNEISRAKAAENELNTKIESIKLDDITAIYATDTFSDVNKGISTAQAAMLRSLELRIHELESVIYNNQFMTTSPISSSIDYFTTNGTGSITGLTNSGKAANEIVIPSKINGVTITNIGDGAFYGCNNLTNVIVPSSVTSIGNHAFAYCENLISVTIPDSVINIGKNAFNECPNLVYIVIPNNVTNIGEWTFNGCASLASITIPNGVTSIGNTALAYCTNLTSITIPNSVISIGNEVFGNCANLISVVIPNSVTSIGEYAFYKCTNLTNVTIPNGVTSISEGTFNDCKKLTNVNIPSSVTSIGDKAFKGCTSLITVSYAGTKEQWNAINVGADNNQLTNATIIYN